MRLVVADASPVNYLILIAIRIALAEPGSLLLIDESAGRAVASRLGIDNTGTLGVLLAAPGYGWIDLGASLERLRQTDFRVSQSLIERLLETNRDKI